MSKKFHADLERRTRIPNNLGPAVRRQVAAEPAPDLADTGKIESIMRAAERVSSERAHAGGGAGAGPWAIGQTVFSRADKPTYVIGALLIIVVLALLWMYGWEQRDHRLSINANTAAIAAMTTTLSGLTSAVQEGNRLIADLDDELGKVREIDGQMDKLGGSIWAMRTLLSDLQNDLELVTGTQRRRVVPQYQGPSYAPDWDFDGGAPQGAPPPGR